MNENKFYINDLSEIRAFCTNSDKEDVYKYIYSLQQENKQLKEDLKVYGKIFDTFSKRKYAHRYLEEKRKENPNLIGLDSDEIYEKYYQLKYIIDELEKWLMDKNNQKYSKDIWNYSVNSWVLTKLQELKGSDKE